MSCSQPLFPFNVQEPLARETKNEDFQRCGTQPSTRIFFNNSYHSQKNIYQDQHATTSYVEIQKKNSIFQNGMTCYGALSLVRSWCGASTQSFIVTPFGFKRAKNSGSTCCISVSVMLDICKGTSRFAVQAKAVFACILQVIFNFFFNNSQDVIIES